MKRFITYNSKLKQRASEMRKNMTKTEQILWFNYLKNQNFRVLRQRPIDNFIVDFYIPSKKLIIEIDGENHYTYEGLAYDEERSSILTGLGLNVIRFTNNEILNDFNNVCYKLNNLIS